MQRVSKKKLLRRSKILQNIQKKINFQNLPQPSIRYPNLIYLSGLI